MSLRLFHSSVALKRLEIQLLSRAQTHMASQLKTLYETGFQVWMSSPYCTRHMYIYYVFWGLVDMITNLGIEDSWNPLKLTPKSWFTAQQKNFQRNEIGCTSTDYLFEIDIADFTDDVTFSLKRSLGGQNNFPSNLIIIKIRNKWWEMNDNGLKNFNRKRGSVNQMVLQRATPHRDFHFRFILISFWICL